MQLIAAAAVHYILCMQLKCSCYWPKEVEQELDCGDGLTVQLEEELVFAEYKIKKFIVSDVSQCCIDHGICS